MIRMLTGDCRDVLATLPAASVQCVVTSPPYYALRSYLDATHPDKAREIGSEVSPDEYLATMVQVFREVRRVLRDDGTCWVNMGDSYASTVNGRSAADTKLAGNDDRTFRDKPFSTVGNGYKPKDLLMMPSRLALALQADGWWVRSDIIWHKPNPMPESVTDRPTSAHEHVFLLTRNARYFYDAEAVREPSVSDHVSGNGYARPEQLSRGGRGQADGWTDVGGARNMRNVWTIATHAYPDAHFATFPPELAERCIKAGTSERGCCAACGAPWVRVVERAVVPLQATNNARSCDQNYRGAMPRSNLETTTTGWVPSCACEAGVVPCTVMDPFAGAGTTLLVADRLQRYAIGIELNPAYADMATDRVRDDAGLFAEIA